MPTYFIPKINLFVLSRKFNLKKIISSQHLKITLISSSCSIPYFHKSHKDYDCSCLQIRFESSYSKKWCRVQNEFAKEICRNIILGYKVINFFVYLILCCTKSDENNHFVGKIPSLSPESFQIIFSFDTFSRHVYI